MGLWSPGGLVQDMEGNSSSVASQLTSGVTQIFSTGCCFCSIEEQWVCGHLGAFIKWRGQQIALASWVKYNVTVKAGCCGSSYTEKFDVVQPEIEGTIKSNFGQTKSNSENR